MRHIRTQALARNPDGALTTLSAVAFTAAGLAAVLPGPAWVSRLAGGGDLAQALPQRPANHALGWPVTAGLPLLPVSQYLVAGRSEQADDHPGRVAAAATAVGPFNPKLAQKVTSSLPRSTSPAITLAPPGEATPASFAKRVAADRVDPSSLGRTDGQGFPRTPAQADLALAAATGVGSPAGRPSSAQDIGAGALADPVAAAGAAAASHLARPAATSATPVSAGSPIQPAVVGEIAEPAAKASPLREPVPASLSDKPLDAVRAPLSAARLAEIGDHPRVGLSQALPVEVTGSRRHRSSRAHGDRVASAFAAATRTSSGSAAASQPGSHVRTADLASSRSAISDYRMTARGVEFATIARTRGAASNRVHLLIADNQDILVRLADVLVLVRPLMAAAQYDRLSASAEADWFISLNDLRAAGIPVRFQENDELSFGVL